MTRTNKQGDDQELSNLEKDLQKIKKHIGMIEDKPPAKVRETHYYLFGVRGLKILSKVETVGDRDQWLSR